MITLAFWHFLLSGTDSLLKFASNDFTFSPPLFGFSVDYFSTLSWRFIILLVIFATPLRKLSVANVFRIHWKMMKVEFQTLHDGMHFLFRYSVVRRHFPYFWICFYLWLSSIFDGIWKAVPCFLAYLHVMVFCVSNKNDTLFWNICFFLSYRATAEFCFEIVLCAIHLILPLFSCLRGLFCDNSEVCVG